MYRRQASERCIDGGVIEMARPPPLDAAEPENWRSC
jgi:hypothetical protein